MNRTQAMDLAQRVAGTWNARWTDTHLDAWAEELVELDHAQVLGAIRKLRRSLDKPPSLAQFLAEVGATKQDRFEVNHCPRCNGNGWIDAGADTRDLGRGLVLEGNAVRRCPDCHGQRRPAEPEAAF